MATVKLSRQERASRTRARIIETAYQLLVDRGWESTTMQLVANEAGVAVQTVYFVFGTKARLVAAVEEYAIAGSTPPEQFLSQWRKSVVEQDDPASLVRTFVEVDTQIKSRLAPLVAGLGGTMPSELVQARDRESGRERFFGSLVDRLADLKVLRPSLRRDRAMDIVRAVNALSTYTDLTRRRGWSDEEWIEWMTEMLSAQLIVAKRKA